jgi:predicted nucleic acid-binding protein
MARPVYFDTSVFLEIGVKKSKYAKQIKELMLELRAEKVRICTSILTIQEASVLSYRRGALARDDYGRINEFARILGVTKDVALTAAKLEAQIKDAAGKTEADDNRRRKWDCFHIATALASGCAKLYTTDEKLIKRQKQLGITELHISLPNPTQKTLDFSAPVLPLQPSK